MNAEEPYSLTTASPLLILRRNLIGVLSLWAASAAWAETSELDGLYRPTETGGLEWSCEEQDIGRDGGALALKGSFIYGVESICELVPLDEGARFQSFTHSAECTAEG